MLLRDAVDIPTAQQNLAGGHPDHLAVGHHLDELADPVSCHAGVHRSRLADRSCLLLIGENGTGLIGQVRFDARVDGVEVSISVAPEHRGAVGDHGHGVAFDGQVSCILRVLGNGHAHARHPGGVGTG